MAILATALLPHPIHVIPEIGLENALIPLSNEMENIASQIALLKPETIVILSAHAEGYRDYFQVFDGEVGMGSLAQFGAHDINFRILYDKEFSRRLSSLAESRKFPAGITGDRGSFLDYGTMVPLYFVLKKISNFRLVRIAVSSLSLLDHYRLGELIREISEILKRKVVIIASGELSHHLEEGGDFGFSQDGPKYEESMQKALENANFLQFLTQNRYILANAGECGHRCLCVMAGALDAQRVSVSSYFHHVWKGIGYATSFYKVLGADATRSFEKLYLSKEAYSISNLLATSHKYTQLARKAIQVKISEDAKIAVPEEEEFLVPSKPLFVTIRMHGTLHGCIGTLKPLRKNLGSEIIENAISASKDPRFPPLKRDHFPYLDVSIDILGSFQRIHSLFKLDPSRYGVFVQSGKRHGFVLPNQEGIETREEQLEAAKIKAGIAFDDPVTLYRVPVTHYR